MHINKTLGGVLSLVIVGLGYAALSQQGSSISDLKSNVDLQNSSSAVMKSATSSNPGPIGGYGSVKDKVPSEALAQTVLTTGVRNSLKSTNIKYNNSGAFVIDNNRTKLNADVSSAPYVMIAHQDMNGRPQAANALLTQATREYRNRQQTGNAKTINPDGWHQLTLYKGKVLYNRGHSIGYALAGNIKGFDASEANPLNITTQTAWANQSSNGNPSNTGQNYYESVVRKRLDQSKSVRIRYRVTPIYDGSNLVPSGSHMEAKANDGSLEFNVFVPNVQPGVNIDYATGEGTIVE